MIGSAILGLVGTAANLAMNASTNKTNSEINQNLLNYNREEAEKADARTRALYNDLYSPAAKAEQLRNAGLSVGLMYGTGGTGGTSSTQGAQASSINPIAARAAQVDPMALSQMQVNDATANKLNSEAELMKEQTNTQKDTQEQLKALKENIEQQTNKLTEEINKVKQEVLTDQAREKLLKTQNELNKTIKNLNTQQWQFNEDTYYIRMDSILKQNKLFEESARKIRDEAQNEKDKHEMFVLTKSMQVDFLGKQIMELMQKIDLVNPAQAALLNQSAILKAYENEDWQTFKEACRSKGIPASKSFFGAATEYEKILKHLEAEKDITKFRHKQNTIWGIPENAAGSFGTAFGRTIGAAAGAKIGGAILGL